MPRLEDRDESLLGRVQRGSTNRTTYDGCEGVHETLDRQITNYSNAGDAADKIDGKVLSTIAFMTSISPFIQRKPAEPVVAETVVTKTEKSMTEHIVDVDLKQGMQSAVLAHCKKVSAPSPPLSDNEEEVTQSSTPGLAAIIVVTKKMKDACPPQPDWPSWMNHPPTPRLTPTRHTTVAKRSPGRNTKGSNCNVWGATASSTCSTATTNTLSICCVHTTDVLPRALLSR